MSDIARQPAEDGYDAEANSIGCWADATAVMALATAIQKAIDSYHVTPGLPPSRWIAAELARKWPGIVAAVKAGA